MDLGKEEKVDLWFAPSFSCIHWRAQKEPEEKWKNHLEKTDKAQFTILQENSNELVYEGGELSIHRPYLLSDSSQF